MTKQLVNNVTIEIRLFKDHQGNQTCASDFEAGECCKFLQTKNFGTVYTCFFSDNKLIRSCSGFLIPDTKCRFTQVIED